MKNPNRNKHMKRWLVLLGVVGPIPGAVAQSTNDIGTPDGGLFQMQVTLTSPLKPNELAKGKLILSGSAVEAAKTHSPLQLFNPLAASKYGSPEDNALRDPSNGKVRGLKLFSLSF